MRAASRTVADGQDRRAEVVAATRRVIARDGLDKASMRAIAQELDCTTGVLTHYFRDKEAMLDVVLAEIVAGVDDRRRQLLSGDYGLADVIDYLCDTLPNSEDQIEWWKAWLAFTSASFGAGRRGSTHTRFYDQLRRNWESSFRTLAARGEIRADIDPALEGDSLLALLDGMGVQILISPDKLPPNRQRAILTRHFSSITF